MPNRSIVVGIQTIGCSHSDTVAVLNNCRACSSVVNGALPYAKGIWRCEATRLVVDKQYRPPAPFEPIEHDLDPAVAAVWAVYEATFKDACVMD